MNLKSTLAAALCASAVLYAAGCAPPPSPQDGAGAALSFQGGGGAQANARPAATPAAAEIHVQNPLPPPTGFVNDFAEVIGAEAQAALEAKLARLKKQERIEFAVATVETTGEADIFDYSLAVARGWGLGPPAGEGGGGLLLLLAVKDRKWRIQVSRSLEADLPDETTGEIGRRMTPHLRRGDFDAGVGACVEGLVRHLAARRNFKADDILNAKPAALEMKAVN